MCLVKVGITDDLRKRLSALRTASPVELVLLAHMPGNLKLERWIHQRLHKVHSRGEWFFDGPDVRAYVDEALSYPQSMPIRRDHKAHRAAEEVMRLTGLNQEAAFDLLAANRAIIRAFDRGPKIAAGKLIAEAFNQSRATIS